MEQKFQIGDFVVPNDGANSIYCSSTQSMYARGIIVSLRITKMHAGDLNDIQQAEITLNDGRGPRVTCCELGQSRDFHKLSSENKMVKLTQNQKKMLSADVQILIANEMLDANLKITAKGSEFISARYLNENIAAIAAEVAANAEADKAEAKSPDFLD